MAYVVNQACVNCKYGDCVEVCPVSCFYEGPDQVYINPTECIDCDACRETCPVQAITTGDDATPEYTAKNAAFAFSEDLRRTKKEDVKHGSAWDASKAH